MSALGADHVEASCDEATSTADAVSSADAASSHGARRSEDAVRGHEPNAGGDGQRIAGAVLGTLIGFKDAGRTPLVLFPGQISTAAVAARTTVDLHGAHIGGQVVLMFEDADPARPIVLGRLRQDESWPLPERPGNLEVQADGERLVVGAKQQLVLRCGSASITLTKAGKVLIQGTFVLHRSTGVMRIKGGSIQLN